MFLNISMTIKLFCSSGCSCTWTCFNIYLSIIYFIWYTVRNTMKQICVPPNATRNTKLRGAQRSPELAFRSTDFHLPENVIFPVLMSILWITSISILSFVFFIRIFILIFIIGIFFSRIFLSIIFSIRIKKFLCHE